MLTPLLPSALILTALLTGLSTLPAADWPQYRGPHQNGVSPEKTLLKPWPANGLRQVWKSPTPGGFSSLAVSGQTVCTLVKRDHNGAATEFCLALDAATGQERWATPLGPAKYDGGGDAGGGGDGPRSTPTLHDKLVYAFDARLNLHCLDIATGKVVWKKDLVAEFGGKVMTWQNAASPIVDKDKVIVAGGGPGQALLAFHRQTGALLWKGENDKATHATPIATTILGVRQVIFITQTGLVAVNPDNGVVLWRHAFPFNVSTAASPVVDGDRVYCSAGYDVGALLVQVRRQLNAWTPTEVWRKPKELFNHWSTPVCLNGHLYGMFSFKEYKTGPLKCIELATGREVWSQGGFGPGNVIVAGGKLVVLGDKGQLVLIEPTPKGYQELSRMPALGGKCWSTPAFCNGRFYLRSTTEAVCLETGK